MPRPALSPDATEYAWRQLAQRAGCTETDLVAEASPAPVHYGHPNRASWTRPGINVIPCSESAWSRLLNLPSDSLKWLPQDRVLPPGAVLPFADPIPVLFWGAGYEGGDKPFAERLENGAVVFYADILAATLFMLSRWEEMTIPERDEHERFPASASVAHRQGFLDRPIVDEYALVLRAWLKAVLHSWRPKPRSWSIHLSHDIDRVCPFRSVSDFLRCAGSALLKYRDPAAVIDTLADGLWQVSGLSKTSSLLGIRELMERSIDHGFGDDAFYFMTADSTALDDGYKLTEPKLKPILQTIQDTGFELGLHASYRSALDLGLLAKEKERMDLVLGKTSYGGRQHFLRFRVPETWRNWESMGFAYDSTMAYPTYEGFRCGTCHDYRPFDIEQNRVLDLWERPLVAMDMTLFHRYTPESGERRVLELLQRCRAVEGNFTLLWHNSSLHGVWRKWRPVYERLLKLRSNYTDLRVNSGLAEPQD